MTKPHVIILGAGAALPLPLRVSSVRETTSA